MNPGPTVHAIMLDSVPKSPGEGRVRCSDYLAYIQSRSLRGFVLCCHLTGGQQRVLIEQYGYLHTRDYATTDLAIWWQILPSICNVRERSVDSTAAIWYYCAPHLGCRNGILDMHSKRLRIVRGVTRRETEMKYQPSVSARSPLCCSVTVFQRDPAACAEILANLEVCKGGKRYFVAPSAA